MSEQWDGRPQNPERDGWHWLRGRPNGEPEPLFWFDETDGDGDGFGWQLDYDVGTPEQVSRIFDYLGPCLTPFEVAAQVEAARREEREANAEVIRHHASLAHNMQKIARGGEEAAYWQTIANALELSAAAIKEAGHD